MAAIAQSAQALPVSCVSTRNSVHHKCAARAVLVRGGRNVASGRFHGTKYRSIDGALVVATMQPRARLWNRRVPQLFCNNSYYDDVQDLSFAIQLLMFLK